MSKSDICTEMQQFGKRDIASSDLTVVTTIAVEAESTRIARGRGGKKDVMIGKNSQPKILMFRPDTEEETSRASERCMTDYQHENVARLHEQLEE